jgi:hypothetical protein
MLEMDQEWIALDHSPSPAILVYGENLSLALLKSGKVAPTDFIKYYKKLLNLPDQSIPTIINIFKVSPVILNGNEHIEAKKAFSKKYKNMEESIKKWLPQYTISFFSNTSTDTEINPIEFVTNYVSGFFRNILAMDLNIDPSQIPTLPPKIFFLTQPLARLTDVESRLFDLRDFLEKTLISQKREPSEAWILLAIIVAGFQALEGTLLYGIIKNPSDEKIWNSKSLLRESAAVNFIGRRVLEDFKIHNLSLVKNQELYVCPTLVHQYQDAKKIDSNNNSFSFGKGPHSCIGQVISEAVVSSFFAEWPLFLERLPSFLSIKYTRDFNLAFSLK